MWLGQQFNVHGHALVFVRRAAGQHVAIVGGDGSARYGMLAGALASLTVLHRPEDVRIEILDRSLETAPGGGTIDLVCDRLLLRLGYDVGLYKAPDDFTGIIDRLTQTLEQRLSPTASTADEPALIAVITEPDRIPSLRRPEAATRGGNPLYDKFARLLAEGPQVGIHFVITASSYRLLSQAVDERRELKHLNHRVALQMSEEDSFAFVRNRKAAQLQLAGPRPVCAIYLDVERGQGGLRFKPYDCHQLDADLQGIAARLAARDRGAAAPTTAGVH
jgi:S-DNA-T family DNA segregation ATPase FtsK/SpoIIIE